MRKHQNEDESVKSIGLEFPWMLQREYKEERERERKKDCKLFYQITIAKSIIERERERESKEIVVCICLWFRDS